jgi:hypothetical protein
MTMTEQPSTELTSPALPSTPPLTIAVAWLVAAAAVAASGIPARLRPPAPQFILLALTAALIVLGRRAGRFRDWLARLDWRTIVGFHTSRAIAGAAFLAAAQRGELPKRWAEPSAYGDIAVAALALFVVVAFSPQRPISRRVFFLWNIIGLADILAVVVGAARVAMADPSAMVGLFRLPLALIPLWLVPLIIASHVLLFARLRVAR